MANGEGRHPPRWLRPGTFADRKFIDEPMSSGNALVARPDSTISPPLRRQHRGHEARARGRPRHRRRPRQGVLRGRSASTSTSTTVPATTSGSCSSPRPGRRARSPSAIGLTSSEPGSAQGLHLVVGDIEERTRGAGRPRRRGERGLPLRSRRPGARPRPRRAPTTARSRSSAIPTATRGCSRRSVGGAGRVTADELVAGGDAGRRAAFVVARRAPPPRAARALLPDARLVRRGRGRGAGDDAPRLAVPGPVRRRSQFRAWLYRIATNVCLDQLRQRAPAPVERRHSFAEVPWLQPYPDRLLDEVAATDDEPDAVVVERETIELAFLAALQALPGPPASGADRPRRARAAGHARRRRCSTRQRGGRQQRAPAGPGDDAGSTCRRSAPSGPSGAPSAEERALLDRFIDAHERCDADARRWRSPPPTSASRCRRTRSSSTGIDDRRAAARARVRRGPRRRLAARAHLGQPHAGRRELPAPAGRLRVPRVQARRPARRGRADRRDHHVRVLAVPGVRPARRCSTARELHRPATPESGGPASTHWRRWSVSAGRRRAVGPEPG